MHSLHLLSLVACVLSAALASAILARNSRERALRLMATILGFASLWAFIDLIGFSADRREVAVTALRASLAATLPLGVLCVDLLLELRPRLRRRFAGGLRVLYLLTPLVALASLCTSWFVADAVRTSWRWSAIHGPVYAAALLFMIGPPAVAFAGLFRGHAARDPELRFIDSASMATAIGLPLLVVIGIDVVYVDLDRAVPRLGPLSIALVSGTLWIRTIHRGYVSAPLNITAREILDRLSHGVAVLSTDGRFRAINRSLASLLRCEEPHELELAELLPDTPEQLWGGLLDHETMLRIQRRTMIPVSISTAVIRDSQGAVSGLVLTVKDQRQVVELRRQLVTSGRLAAVGELAAGIAHEVNNPIAFIQANLNLLSHHREELDAALDKAGEDAPPAADVARAGIETSLREIGRVASVVREVVDFAHCGSGGRRPHDVNGVLDAALRLAALRRGHALAVERSHGELAPVVCAEQDLKHVLVNILVGVTETSAERPLRVSTECEAGSVFIRIEDERWVVAPQLVDRAFDPAVDADGHDGTDGLGFSLAYQIVRQLGGELTVERRSEGGTRVVVRLPAYDPSETGEAELPAEMPA